MIICAALGIARAVRVWLASSAHTISFTMQRQLIAAAELHSMIGFEVARILCEHDVNLLRFAAVELSLQYLATARLALREDDRPFSNRHSDSSTVNTLKANEIQDNALRYAIIMHRLAGRLGVIAQRALAGKPAEYVARQVGAVSGGATGSKDAGKGRPPTAAVPGGGSLVTPDDEKVRTVLPPSLFEDLQAYRKAAALSATAVMQAATNDPKSEGKVTAPTPTAVILFSHMSALYSMMRAWPSVGGPLAASVEDSAQSLHSSLCSLLPVYRSAWGLSRPLHARLQSARAQATPSDPATASTPSGSRKGSVISTSTTGTVTPRLLLKPSPYGMPSNSRVIRVSYGPGEMQNPNNTTISSFIGVSSSIITRNDEELTDGSTALLALLLGPTSMGEMANASTATTTTGTNPPSTAKGSSKPGTATSQPATTVPPVDTETTPKVDTANSDILILRLDIPAHELLSIREAYADLRQRYRQLLDPAAIQAHQLLNPVSSTTTTTSTEETIITVPGTKPLDSIAEANDTLVALCNRFGTLLRTILESQYYNITSEVPSIIDIINTYKSTKSASGVPNTTAPPAKDAKGKDASAVPVSTDKDAGDESDDEFVVLPPATTTPTPATTTTPIETINPQLAVRIVDTFCRLLDHRFGGSSRQGVVNQWIRATIGIN